MDAIIKSLVEDLLGNDSTFASAKNFDALKEWLITTPNTEAAETIRQAVSEYFSDMEITSDAAKEYFNSVIEYRIGLLDDELNLLSKQKEALEHINEERKYERDLIESKLEQIETGFEYTPYGQ